MHRTLWIMMIAACCATSAHAQEKPVRFGVGYAFANYLEEGQGSAPFGLFFAVQGREDISIKGEVSYHRDTSDYSDEALNTFIGMVGPVANFPAGTSQGFVHLLFGGREDRFLGEGNFSLGGELGAGFDIPASTSVFIRPGLDFQAFTDEGVTLKVLRLSLGIAF